MLTSMQWIGTGVGVIAVLVGIVGMVRNEIVLTRKNPLTGVWAIVAGLFSMVVGVTLVVVCLIVVPWILTEDGPKDRYPRNRQSRGPDRFYFPAVDRD